MFTKTSRDQSAHGDKFHFLFPPPPTFIIKYSANPHDSASRGLLVWIYSIQRSMSDLAAERLRREFTSMKTHLDKEVPVRGAHQAGFSSSFTF